MSLSGTPVSSSVTNGQGIYDIKGVAPGKYQLELLPVTGGFLGEISNVQVGPHGATVNVLVPQNEALLALGDSSACHT